MEHLYNWVFHYNHFNKIWSAIPRDHYFDYWENAKHPSIIRSSSMETLIELTKKVKEDPDFLTKIK